MPIKNIAGQRFGRYVVLELAGADKSGNSIWKCRCDCGTVKNIAARQFWRGHVKSCGCYATEVKREMAKNLPPFPVKHGHGHGSPEYRSWLAMRRRCDYPSTPGYHNYGGRGITVCERWNNSFESFLADMGPRTAGRTLDRIDVNGNYEPGNCRWATGKEQYANKRKLKPVTQSTLDAEREALISGRDPIHDSNGRW